MLALGARAITHFRGNRVVLRDVHLEIAAGERFAIVGPNGAGKSTLLRLLALLEEPSEGEIIIREKGKRLSADLALRRRMVMVFQHSFLFHASVFGNVLYGLRVRGLPASLARERTQKALEMTGLEELARRPARNLSAGESQLVNLARALALDPEVLFLDEVTAHLDPNNEAKVEEILLRFSEEGKAAVVLVTQNLPQACRLANRGVMLYEGEVVGKGILREFLHQPIDDRVARFLRGQVLKAAP